MSRAYLQSEASQQREKTKAAEQMLALGNTALEQGNPQQARRAFESAYGLSQHDNAFNEDARVQLHNLKLQQALVGLNVRNNPSPASPIRSRASSAHGGAATRTPTTRSRTRRTIMDRNTADENAALHAPAPSASSSNRTPPSRNPAAIQASIPEQGRLLTFSRTVAVDNWADLQIGLKAKAVKAAGWFKRLLILAVTALVLVLFVRFADAFRKPRSNGGAVLS